MKRIIALLLALLLTGCTPGGSLPGKSQPEQNAVQPDWIEETATAWDQEGALVEIPLRIPGGMQYVSAQEFDGDLLLWSADSHLTDSTVVELCLVELDDGSIIACQEVALKHFTVPQPLTDKLYLCDSEAGLVVELDKNLQETQRWETEPEMGTWYMSAGGMLYRQDLELRMSVENLATGERTPLLEGNPETLIAGNDNRTMVLQYYREDTGAQCWAALDLTTGALTLLDIGIGYDSLSVAGDAWLASKYMDSYVYILCAGSGERMNVAAPQDYLQLMEDGKILLTSEDGTWLRLYDLQGKAVASCRLSETGNYTASRLIWNEKHGGYFFIARGYEDHCRLMFWDTAKGSRGSDLVLTPVPEPSQETIALWERCQEISEKYGVNILVGDDCNTVFQEFTASTVSDWDRVDTALTVLEDALQDYPEGFFRQLRTDSIHSVQIQLVCDLLANGEYGREGDGYAAFTHEMWDHYLIVADIDDTSEETYYHEFSHVIDSWLLWVSWQRDDSPYSEENWMALNPDWFEGYSYDYGELPLLDDETCFVDSYSMISPTEDRARVLEFAMYEYGRWTFENAPVLEAKLEYYCRCIRDAFDTTGWPETVLWEQYLK